MAIACHRPTRRSGDAPSALRPPTVCKDIDRLADSVRTRADLDRPDPTLGYASGQCPTLAADAVAHGLWRYRLPADSLRFEFWLRGTGPIDRAVFESALAVLADSGPAPVADATRLRAWDGADRMVQLSVTGNHLMRRSGPPVDSAGRCLEEGVGAYTETAFSHGPRVVRPLPTDAGGRLRSVTKAVALRRGASVRLRNGLGFC
jgi:hypothetical protein